MQIVKLMVAGIFIRPARTMPYPAVLWQYTFGEPALEPIHPPETFCILYTSRHAPELCLHFYHLLKVSCGKIMHGLELAFMTGEHFRFYSEHIGDIHVLCRLKVDTSQVIHKIYL